VATAALTHSGPLVAGIAVGGFLIDIDHAVDYVLFDGQRDLRPATFLRYYVEGRMRRAVLVLHSYELFALLGAVALWIQALPLWGYLLGGLMHLALDLVFNGETTPRSIAAFYSFGYRLAHRFDATALLGTAPQLATESFWRTFFRRPTPMSPSSSTDSLTPLA
jgi:hypothetical protein